MQAKAKRKNQSKKNCFNMIPVNIDKSTMFRITMFGSRNLLLPEWKTPIAVSDSLLLLNRVEKRKVNKLGVAKVKDVKKFTVKFSDKIDDCICYLDGKQLTDAELTTIVESLWNRKLKDGDLSTFKIIVFSACKTRESFFERTYKGQLINFEFKLCTPL